MAIGCIIRSLTALCTNTTSQDVQLDTMPAKLKIQWDKIVALDSTTKPDLIRVGFKRSGEFYTARTQLPAQIGNSVQTTIGIMAPGDFVPCARFEGADEDDVLELYAFGEIVEEGK